MQARITYRKIYMANGDDFYKKLKILLEMEYHACKNMHLTHTAFESNYQYFINDEISELEESIARQVKALA